MDIALANIEQNLNGIKKIEQDLEYLSARDLMAILGYATWRKFEIAISRAKESCIASGHNASDHFVGAGKMVSTGSGATM